jgi:hypothetical protein
VKIHRQQTNRWPIESACDCLQDRLAELESAARIGDECIADYVDGVSAAVQRLLNELERLEFRHRAVLGERVSLLASRKQDGEARLNYYPQIVDAELWQAAQSAISARRVKTASGAVTGNFQGALARSSTCSRG